MAYFQQIADAELRCETCGNQLEFDVTTMYDDNQKAHVCMECGRPININLLS